MSNLTLDALAALVVLIQAGALAGALWRGNLVFIVALNLLAAVAVLIAVIPNLMDYKSFADDFVEFLLILLVTETVALAASLVWLAYRRLAWLRGAYSRSTRRSASPSSSSYSRSRSRGRSDRAGHALQLAMSRHKIA